jgi:mannose-6-phosphate isomerase-like protein (cupin superfamily)
MHVRRIVTAEHDDGRSFAVAVETVTPVSGHLDWHPIWGWDQLPALPVHAPERESVSSTFPAIGGARVAVSIMPPRSERRPPSADLMGLINAVPGRGRQGWSTDFHDTGTVDVVFVISGQVSMALSGGETITMGQGDVLIQNGTFHVWRNEETEPCVLGLVLLGADRIDSEANGPVR